jgi:LppX/LprAFG-like lipoprotein
MRSRFIRIRYITSLCALLMLLAGCSGDTKSGPSAKDLISKAQTAMQKVTSYHFNLTAENPGTAGLLAIQSADGDVLVPDKLKANANAFMLGSLVQVKIVSIGEKQYYTDPVTQEWNATNGLLDPRTLTDPQTGLVGILGHIEDPGTPTDDTVNGTACWSIKGKLDAKYLASITGGGVPSGTKVNVTTWIGKNDNLLYQLRINGKAVQGDSDKTVRTFKLSKFGEQLDIQPPV